MSDKKFFEIKCVVKLSYEKQTFGIGWGLICQCACRGCIRGPGDCRDERENITFPGQESCLLKDW